MTLTENFNQAFNSLTEVEKAKVMNFQNLVVEWVDLLKSGEEHNFDAQLEKKLIYLSAHNVIFLRIFGDALSIDKYVLKFKVKDNEHVTGARFRKYFLQFIK